MYTINPTSRYPKRPRLEGFDYSSPGYYFTTVNTYNYQCTLSEIRDYIVVPTWLGRLVMECILEIPKRHSYIVIDSAVIMPNHFHVLFEYKDSVGKRSDLSRVINEIKSKSTVFANKRSGKSGTLWHYGFHDVIIRNEEHLLREREYIQNNPAKWELDELHPANLKKSYCAPHEL
jgi:putative transposase